MMNDKGFTLIEVATVIVVLSIIGVFTFSFLMQSADTYRTMRIQTELHQEASYLLERISREIKDATYISSITSSSISFRRANYSEIIDKSPNVSFFFDGTSLIRSSTNNVNKPVARNVKSFSVAPDPSPLSNDESTRFTISVSLASPNGQTVTDTVVICPKNYCSMGPNSFTCMRNVGGRSFNGDYYDVVQ